MIFTLRLDDEEATRRLGEDLALALAQGDLVTLHGDLGTGKSTLARALIRTLADDSGLEVPSPTFTLVQNYDGLRLPVTHADLYRISTPEEIDELGFDQALEEGVLLVEWPQKAGDLLAQAQFAVFLAHDGAGRKATIHAGGSAAKRLERSLCIRAFLAGQGRATAVRRYLLGDASPRGYETLTLGTRRELLMNAPPMLFADAAARTYAQSVHLATHISRFVGIDRLLRDHGFAAPHIDGADMAAGLLIVEDLGQTGIVDADGQPIAERYLACADMLAALHQVKWPQEMVWPDLSLAIPAYDKNALHAETELLLDWYLPHVAQYSPDQAQRQAFHAVWDTLFDRLLQAEKSLVLRDFHSPNILWQARRQGIGRIGLIDFQDAVIGPGVYDLASLAQDARTAIPAALETAIVAQYKAARGVPAVSTAIDEAYSIAAVQRASKILGIFVRLDKRDGKPGYHQYLPHLHAYLQRTLTAPVLQDLQACYRQLGLLAHVS